jgi:arsenate reductase-like glutaredoxin family protein
MQKSNEFKELFRMKIQGDKDLVCSVVNNIDISISQYTDIINYQDGNVKKGHLKHALRLTKDEFNEFINKINKAKESL